MSKIELPPLPTPDAGVWDYDTKSWTAFTASQLRARDRQIVELCVSLADDAEAGDGSHDYNAGTETMREKIAAAIRALLDEKMENE